MYHKQLQGVKAACLNLFTNNKRWAQEAIATVVCGNYHAENK